MVIVLGHDWYPIVGKAKAKAKAKAKSKGKPSIPTPPLQQNEISASYIEAIPIPEDCAREDCAILFMNLYPDFREPNAPITGPLDSRKPNDPITGPLLSYEQCVKGLEAVCKSISQQQQYRLVRIISWGGPVWKALRKKLGAEWQQFDVMAAVKHQYRHE